MWMDQDGWYRFQCWMQVHSAQFVHTEAVCGLLFAHRSLEVSFSRILPRKARVSFLLGHLVPLCGILALAVISLMGSTSQVIQIRSWTGSGITPHFI